MPGMERKCMNVKMYELIDPSFQKEALASLVAISPESDSKILSFNFRPGVICMRETGESSAKRAGNDASLVRLTIVGRPFGFCHLASCRDLERDSSERLNIF